MARTCNSWPDAATTPFRSEKNTNWEGAFRVPMMVRWPGHIEAGSISNEIVQHHDWLPTFLDMAGDPDVVDKLKKGYKASGRTYKNHIDGVNLLPLPDGQGEGEARASSSSISATTATFWASATTTGRSCSWNNAARAPCRSGASPSRVCAMPKLFNLRTDPYEFADVTSNSYYEWFLYHAYILYGAWGLADKFASTFKDFPPVQHPNSFTIDDALKAMADASAGGGH